MKLTSFNRCIMLSTVQLANASCTVSIRTSFVVDHEGCTKSQAYKVSLLNISPAFFAIPSGGPIAVGSRTCGHCHFFITSKGFDTRASFTCSQEGSDPSDILVC